MPAYEYHFVTVWEVAGSPDEVFAILDDPADLVRWWPSVYLDVVVMNVGNLPFQATGSDLEESFAGYGEVVSAQVVEDRETGRSRGFGFVEMGSEHEMHAAIDGLNDREYGGRRLTVNEAKTREARAGVGGGYGGGRSHGGRDRGGYGGRY